MSKIKRIATVLSLVACSSLAASWVLASMGPESKRRFPDNVLSRIEDAGFPRRQIDEVHPLDLSQIEEIVVRTVSIDVEVNGLPGSEAGATAASGTVQLRSTVSEHVQQALEIKQEGNRLILSTDENEGSRDDWRFTWRTNEPGYERGLKLRLPADWKGRLLFESVSGDLEVKAQLERLESKTVSGDLDFVGLCPNFNIETVSGDTELKLPQSPGLRVDATSVSGDLEAAGLSAIESPGQIRIDSQLGSGSNSVVFESVSGDLEIKTQDQL
jgi:hypothetical protein